MRVAIYVRVSTDKQEARNQTRDLIDYCERKGYNLQFRYIDIISGKETKRPGFDKMLFEAHQRLFDHLLFWDISRFSRAGTLYTLQKLKELENCGVTWESYQETYFNSLGEFKDVVLSIMSTVAKIERQKISERTKAGLKGKKNVGKRGKDKKPRKLRNDRGLKRGVRKKDIDYLLEVRKNNRAKEGGF